VVCAVLVADDGDAGHLPEHKRAALVILLRQLGIEAFEDHLADR
jgi:hypothetical protein